MPDSFKEGFGAKYMTSVTHEELKHGKVPRAKPDLDTTFGDLMQAGIDNKITYFQHS
jgi:hypothetical protein